MKIIKNKFSPLRIFRLIIQILLFILLPALFIETFSGIKLIFLSIIHEDFSFITLLPLILTTIIIIPVTALSGRFFCGWMCAFGTLGDFIHIISLKILKKKIKINKKADTALKFMKYMPARIYSCRCMEYRDKYFQRFQPLGSFRNAAGLRENP